MPILKPSDVRDWPPTCIEVELTAACNLGCKHCYLGEPIGEAMDPEVADGVHSLILRLQQNGLERDGHVPRLAGHLYGGEPFLSFETMRRLVAGTPGVSWTVFTNGITAQPWHIEWCRQHRIVPRRSIPPRSKRNQWLSEGILWEDYDLPHRLTVTPATASDVFSTIRWMHKRGYYGPIDIATDDYSEWDEDSIEIFENEITALSMEFIYQYGQGKMFGIENLINAGRCLYGQGEQFIIGCGAGWNTWGITRHGTIVPCHRFFRTGEGFPPIGGSVWDFLEGRQITFGSPIIEAISSWSRGSERRQCRVCEARMSCQRGCLHVSQEVFNNYESCPSHRCRFTQLFARAAKWIHDAIGKEPWWKRPVGQCPTFGVQ